MAEVVRVQFDGGYAAEGNLHFYEYSRSQYALARFIATIEHFRRTGRVAERITSDTYVELTITAPRRGSFVFDILVHSLEDGVGEVIAAPFLGLMGYIWHRLTPRREKTDATLLELARLKLAIEQEKTQQEGERTHQIRELRHYAEIERVPAEEGLELLRWSESVPEEEVSSAGATRAQRGDMIREVEAEREREEEFRRYETGLSRIDEETFNRLTSRLRRMVPDIGLPLRRSAARMSMGSDRPGQQHLAHLTHEIVRLVESRTTEDEITEIRGRIKSYDRDAGIGKVQSDDLPRILNFSVPVAERRALRDLVLAAMRRNLVTLRCRRIVDDSGQPTSLILVDVVFDENTTA